MHGDHKGHKKKQHCFLNPRPLKMHDQQCKSSCAIDSSILKVHFMLLAKQKADMA